jgi:hypothetical protein
MEVDRVMDGLMKELGVAIKAMGKAKKMDEKEAYSRIVKNLSESLGVFLDVANEMMMFNDEDPEEDDMHF